MTEQNKMDIYNFEQTAGIPPAPGEPTFRDGYKWSEQAQRWNIDVSQSQTKRFEVMLNKNPEMIGIRGAINRERQMDGFEQVLKTPPKEGEPTTIWMNADGYSGEERIWSAEQQRWQITGRCEFNLPPQSGESFTKTVKNDRQIVWSPKELRWFNKGDRRLEK